MEVAKGRILLVEDDNLNGRILKRLLENTNFTIDWVKNGKEAIDFVQNFGTSISLIIMDIQLPIFNGYQVTQTIREQGFDQPIIAMTANAFSDDQVKAIEMGMDDFLLKPISQIELFSMIEKWIPQWENNLLK